MEVPTVTWEDVGGLENVKKELQELVQVWLCNALDSFACPYSYLCIIKMLMVPSINQLYNIAYICALNHQGSEGM